MADTTAKKKKIEHIVEVRHEGKELIVPEGISDREAIEILHNKIKYDEEIVAVHCQVDCFMFEGAYAFYKACEKHFGWVRGVKTPPQNMFDTDHPPAMISIPISRTENIQVPWGRLEMPVLQGYLETSMHGMRGKRAEFMVVGEIRRKHADLVNLIFEDTKKMVKEESIYKGRAFRVRFKDADGDNIPIPSPEFISIHDAPTPNRMVFRRPLQRIIEANIFTVLQRTEEVTRAGVPLKRGVLLSGDYGTGKSLVAAATARMAEECGWTFIECARADELVDVLKLGQFYGNCVVFCEDIDRVVSGDRDMSMDQILNIIDGVHSKGDQSVLVVLTTNDVEAITPAIIRPGRIDALVEMEFPDAEACERLIRMYGREMIGHEEDLVQVGRMLENQSPAMIRDVVEGAKLYNLAESVPGSAIRLTASALETSAYAKQRQMALLKKREVDKRSDLEKAAQILVDGTRQEPNGRHEKEMFAMISAKAEELENPFADR